MSGVKEILDSIDPTEENVEVLYKTFNEIFEHGLPVIRMIFPAGTSFLRQRINEKGKRFTQISELSYPPADKTTQYGRANIPYNPMFYCCTFRKGKDIMPAPRYVALLETSEFAKDQESVGIERATCSKWISCSDLTLISLPFSDTYKRPCEDIKLINKTWQEYTEQNNISAESLELLEYMSCEIAKRFDNSQEYFKVAHFVYYLMRIHPVTKVADGMIYPSVPAEGEGFNVVLKPEVVDRYLMFDNASLCYMAKNKMQMKVMTVNHARVDDGKIEYIDDIKNIEAAQEWFDKIASGLEFRN